MAKKAVMKSLEIDDQRHLEAAQGWFELGNCIEATEELEQIHYWAQNRTRRPLMTWQP
jgi:hypothetical protein